MCGMSMLVTTVAIASFVAIVFQTIVSSQTTVASLFRPSLVFGFRSWAVSHSCCNWKRCLAYNLWDWHHCSCYQKTTHKVVLASSISVIMISKSYEGKWKQWRIKTLHANRIIWILVVIVVFIGGGVGAYCTILLAVWLRIRWAGGSTVATHPPVATISPSAERFCQKGSGDMVISCENVDHLLLLNYSTSGSSGWSKKWVMG
jgi:hypothetical protein